MTNSIKFTESTVRTLEVRAKMYRVGDKNTPNLYVRVQPTGAKTYFYEVRMNNEPIKITIGKAGTEGLTLAQAKEAVQHYNGIKAAGLNPATEIKNKQAAEIAERTAAKSKEEAERITLLDLWGAFVKHKQQQIKDGRKLSSTYIRDMFIHSGTGGIDTERKLNIPPNPNGVLHGILQTRIIDLTAKTITEWRNTNEAIRPTTTNNAARILKAFLNWLEVNHEQHNINTRKLFAGAKISRTNARNEDTLSTEDLKAWLNEARQTKGVGAVFLQFLLLTGARVNEEAAALKWTDIDTKNKVIRLHCKVNGTRNIPMTATLEALIYSLPKRHTYVFPNVGGTGHLTPQNTTMRRICERAGITSTLRPKGFTVYALRRTFTNMARHAQVLEIYANTIKGHSAQTVAQRNYTFITPDELRPQLERIHAHIMALAGIEQTDTTQIGHLKAV